MRKSNILIVCWDFPPHTSIGGRRWAKIGKSLIKLGYNVSVVSGVMHEQVGKIFWIDDAGFSKIKLYTISNHYLVRWLNDYASRFKSLKIRSARILLSALFKGTIFDKAIGIESQFLKLAESVIRQDAIDMVFVTGAPFNLMYYTAKLKTIFPRLKIVADYRDPWINAQNYGMQNLSPSRKREELRKQNYVFEQVDFITAPNPFLLQEIKETYTGHATQLASFIDLPHAYDPDDVIRTELQPKRPGHIKIIYGGTLYLGIDKYLALLNNAITQLKKENPDLVPEVRFYTNELNKQSFFAENTDHVQFSQSIGDKIFDEISDADFILIMLSEHNRNYITSKYYEFLPYRKPYLYIGPEGYVSDKIEQNQFGYCLRKPEDLARFIIRQGATDSQSRMADLERFTFDAVTRKLLSDIGENNKK